MKKLIALFLVLTFWAVPLFAGDITITFQWDADDTGGWEQIKLFEREASGAYDYATPKSTVPQSYGTDNLSTPTEMTITSNFPDGVSTTKHYVVRAASGTLESADSEEVSYTADLTPLPIPTYTVVYNETTQTIDFSWPTDADSRITSWKIFTKLPDDADWTELVTVDASGSESVPIDTLFPAGERTTREFTMVAYGPFGLFSDNAATSSITVNRRPPSGIINFRIKLVE